MSPFTLWRISNDLWATAGSLADEHALARGLRAHLASVGLCSAVVQVGAAQRAYLALQGCEGCALDRCLPGCRVGLLRRTLRAALGKDAHLTLIRRGLDPFGYQHFLWAWPAGKDARPLSGEVLVGWPRARVITRWRLGRERWGVGATIALGGERQGPALAPRLRELGWTSRPIPPMLHRWATAPFGPLLGLRAGTWPGEPWLLLPAQPAEEAGETVALARVALETPPAAEVAP